MIPFERRLLDAKGFTLLELLIVLALIGVGSAFAIASVDKLAIKLDQRKWEDRTRQTLIAAHKKAVGTGLTIVAAVLFEPAEIRQLVGSESVLLLKLPENFKYELVEKSNSENTTREEKALIYFFSDGAMDGRTFELVSPLGRRYEFKLAKHTGQVSGRVGNAAR